MSVTSNSSVGIKPRRYFANPISKDLLGFWPVNDIRGLKIHNVFTTYDANNDTYLDFVTDYKFGIVGFCRSTGNITYSAKSFITAPYVTSLISANGALTMSTWVKMPNPPEFGNVVSVFEIMNAVPKNYNIYLSTTDVGKVFFTWNSGTNFIKTSSTPYPSGGTDITWHLITCTVDYTGLGTIYIDGESQGTGTYALDTVTDGDVVIGGYSRADAASSSQAYVWGQGIWARALTQAEIQSMFVDPYILFRNNPLNAGQILTGTVYDFMPFFTAQNIRGSNLIGAIR